MKRSFNYTGRQTIARRDVTATLTESRVGGKSSLTVRAELSLYEFPSKAHTKLEATTRSSFWEVFAGPIAAFEGRPVRVDGVDKWVERDEWDGVDFHFKVVDPSNLLLLGATSLPIKLTELPTANIGLLSLSSRDLGELPHRLEIDENGPRLLISNRLWHDRHALTGNPVFRGTVFPELLRQVLHRAVIEDNLFDMEEGAETWFSDWIDWMHSQPDLAGFPDRIEKIDDDDAVSQRAWVEDVVAAFASLFQHRFVTTIEQHFARGG